MTTEEKQLLLKDLSARLPYQVVVSYKNSDTGEAYNQILDPVMYNLVQYIPHVGGLVIKPYLRPMSSMTEEEYYGEYQCKVLIMRDADETLHWLETVDSIDWLNAHHFDFRGLIEKGLALEAPEGMYEKK